MELANIQVDLRPHIARERKQVGGEMVEFPVDLKQCYVMVGGKQVAWYCGRANEPNKYLSFIRPTPKAVQDAIATAVAKLTGGVKDYNAPPPEEHEVTGEE